MIKKDIKFWMDNLPHIVGSPRKCVFARRIWTLIATLKSPNPNSLGLRRGAEEIVYRGYGPIHGIQDSDFLVQYWLKRNT